MNKYSAQFLETYSDLREELDNLQTYSGTFRIAATPVACNYALPCCCLLYTSWHDCDWNRSSGITSVLWSKAIELNSGDRVLIDMAAGTAPEESSATEETDAIVQPIITPPSDISPSNTPTVCLLYTS